MKALSNRQILTIAIALVVALLSVFVFAKIFSSVDHHQKSIAVLEEKRANVIKLAAAATATSAAITLLPGDAATPIAEKLTDLSLGFLIVMVALLLEKYLLTITGYAACYLLIPLACAGVIANVFLKKPSIQRIIVKIVIFALAILLVIPASLKVSAIIEKTYQESIDATITMAEETADEMSSYAASDEDKNILTRTWETITGGVKGLAEKAKSTLNRFIEALAVLIVTSCIIPILVILFFIWLVKLLVGADLSVPNWVDLLRRRPGKRPAAPAGAPALPDTAQEEAESPEPPPEHKDKNQE